MNDAQRKLPVYDRAEMFAFIWLLVSFDRFFFKDRSICLEFY